MAQGQGPSCIWEAWGTLRCDTNFSQHSRRPYQQQSDSSSLRPTIEGFWAGNLEAGEDLNCAKSGTCKEGRACTKSSECAAGLKCYARTCTREANLPKTPDDDSDEEQRARATQRYRNQIENKPERVKENRDLPAQASPVAKQRQELNEERKRLQREREELEEERRELERQKEKQQQRAKKKKKSGWKFW